MRIVIILLTLCLTQASASSFAQQVTYHRNNATLKDVFNEIRKQTGYDVIWPQGSVRSSATLNVSFNKLGLKDVLEVCFQGKPLEYTIENKTIVVREKQTSFLDRIKSSLVAIDVKGRVVDKDMAPMIGATIAVNGKQAAQTDVEGNFKISGIEEGTPLTISYIGFQTKVMPASKIMVAILERGDSRLDEVQVSYGTTVRRTATGNVTKIKGEVINNTPVTNPLLALQGRVPGMIVTQSSGVPGSAVTIQIRGRTQIDTDIGANEDPLFIVDGVPLSTGNGNINLLQSAISASGTGGLSPFSTISPGNIESIEILKDADATAIYGSRGANGVVLITTKKGQSGATAINARISSGFNKAPMPKLLNTQQYIAMRKEAFRNDNKAMTPQNAYDILLWDTTRTTNLAEELIGGRASFTNAEASVSGGTGTTQYSILGTYSRQTNVYPNSWPNTVANINSRLNGRALKNRLGFSFSGTYARGVNRAPVSDLASNLSLPPHFKLYNDDGSLAWNESGSMITGMDNPLGATMQTYKSGTDNLTGNMRLTYNILPELQIIAPIGYNSVGVEEIRNAPRSVLNPLDAYSVTNSQFGNNTSRTFNFEPQLEYKRKIADGALNILVGGAINTQSREGYSFTVRDYATEALIGTLAGNVINQASMFGKYKYNGLFGRATYNYKDTYIINVSGRRDGSSRFGPNYKFATFGAVGASWIFSNLSLLNDSEILSFGKLRASYGTSGKDGIGDFLYRSLYATNLIAPNYQGSVAITPQSFFKPDLRWEQSKKMEFATELGFLNDRIVFNATWYRDNTTDPLVQYPLPYATGFGGVATNLDGVVIQNKGWELSLITDNFKRARFQWTTSFNITLPNNRLLKYPGLAESTYASKYIIGKSLDLKFLTKYLGVDPANGLYTVEDANNSGLLELTPNGDFVPAIDMEPEFYGGLQNDLRYKNISFSFFFNFTKGYQTNWMRRLPTILGSAYNVPVYALNRWQYEGHITDVQKFSTTSPASNSLQGIRAAINSDALYTNVCIVNLQSANLAYNLPEKIIKPLGLKSAGIYLQGGNLFKFAPFSPVDPQSLYLSGLAPLRTYIMGIQFSL